MYKVILNKNYKNLCTLKEGLSLLKLIDVRKNEKNKCFYGIMFHHFHDDKIHKKAKDQFLKINYIK